MNEPEILYYTDAVQDAVGADFDVVYGNDEFNMLDWDYLGQQTKAKVMGIHHLSSLGSWQNPKSHFKNIQDCKTIATLYHKQIMGTECGSYFKPYNGEGHQINKEILKECKNLGYLAALIVMVDINETEYSNNGILGYRVWNEEFTTIKNPGQSEYFQDFMVFAKAEGQQVKIESEDGMILPSTKVGSTGYLTELTEELLKLHGYDVKVDGKLTAADATELDKFFKSIKDKYPNIIIETDPLNTKCGRKGYFYLIQEIADPATKADYQFKLQVYGSPIA